MLNEIEKVLLSNTGNRLTPELCLGLLMTMNSVISKGREEDRRTWEIERLQREEEARTQVAATPATSAAPSVRTARSRAK